MKTARPVMTRAPLAVLLALLMVMTMQVAEANAWYYRSVWFSGQSYLRTTGGSESYTYSEAPVHDGISVRHHYRRDDTWFVTSWGYGYGDIIVRGQSGRVDGRNCNGDHRVKVDGSWSGLYKSYC